MNRIINVSLLVLVMMGISCCPSVFGASNNQCADVYSTAVRPNQLEVYFPSLGQDPAPVMVTLIDNTKDKIDMAVYQLTDPDIIAALDKAEGRGVQVRIILDRNQLQGKYNTAAIAILRADGISIRINSHPGQMNLKMTIFDSKIITTGSWDYTLQASETDDNNFVICSESQFIKICSDEFNRMWGSGQFIDLGS